MNTASTLLSPLTYGEHTLIQKGMNTLDLIPFAGWCGEHTLIQQGMNTIVGISLGLLVGEHTFIPKGMKTRPKKKKTVK